MQGMRCMGCNKTEYAYHLPAIQRHIMLALSCQPPALQYTDAIAIFDLLDIHLVHGWLVDPQVMNRGCAQIAF